MRKIFTTLLLVFSLSVCKAQQLNPPSVEWHKCYGGSQFDIARSIKPTIDGGYIIAGSTKSTDGDFNGGHGGEDAMIVKIDSIGNLEWAKNYGGSSDERASIAYPTSDGGYIFGGITISDDGDLIPIHCDSIYDFSGNFVSCLYLGDYWVVKLDHFGNIEWSKQYGGPGNDNLTSLVPIPSGGYYLSGTGSLCGTSSCNGGDISSPSGYNFCWILKIDSIGNIIWEKSFGTNWQLFNNSAKLSNDGSGLISANWYGGWNSSSNGGDVANANYQNIPGSLNGDQSWLFKIDSLGNIIWSSVLIPNPYGAFSGPHYFIPLKSGNIFMSIRVEGGCVLDHNFWYPIANENGVLVDSFLHSCLSFPYDEMANAGIESSDSLIIQTYRNFIEKFDMDGNLLWRNEFNEFSTYYGLNLNYDGSMIAVGTIEDYDCNYGLKDIWVVKFNNDIGCQANETFISDSICNGDIYYFNGQNLTNTGLYIDTISSFNGCDSVIHLQFTVQQSNSSIGQTICLGDSYHFNGVDLYTQGIYYDTLTSIISGCDSVISLHLVVLNPSYLLIENICSGESYNFNGINLSTSGIYLDTLNSSLDCDSIITLNLTVESVNINIQQSFNALVASSTTGTFQWFDCNLQQIIPGATSSVFIPTTSGMYAAIVTEGNCSDTSSCIQIFTSVNDLSIDYSQFTIYPNPTDENITVQLSQPCNNCRIEISNTLGELVQSSEFKVQSMQLDIHLLPAGIYFITLRSDKINLVKKLVRD